MKSGPPPSGGSKSCRPATCIGCSRDSPMRNIESVGEINFIDVTVPTPPVIRARYRGQSFCTRGDDDEHSWQSGRQGRVHHRCSARPGPRTRHPARGGRRRHHRGRCVRATSTALGYPGATEADLDETAALVEKLDRRIVTAKADVRDLEGLRAALQQGVDELGRPDVVVANAGISGHPSPAALIEEACVADDARHQSDRRLAHGQGGTAPYVRWPRRIDHLGELDVGTSRRWLYGPLRVGKARRRRLDELAGQ